MNCVRLFSCSLPFALLASAPAQDLAKFLPKHAQIVAVSDGPKRLAERFEGTNIARMLSSPEAQPIRAIPTVVVDFVAGLAEQNGSKFDLHGLLDTLAGYGGRVGIGVEFDLAASRASGSIEFLLSVVAEPDGSTDLGALGEKIADEADRGGATLSEIDAGPGFRALIHPADVDVTLPRLVDGHLVMFVGSRLDDSLPRGFGADATLGAKLPETAAEAAMLLHVDGGIVELLTLAIEIGNRNAPRGRYGSSSSRPSQMDESVSRLVRSLTERLSFEDIEVSLSRSGQYLRTVGEIHGDASREGLIDLFQPKAKSTPIGRLVPAGNQDWQYLRFDIAAVAKLLITALEAEQPGVGGLIGSALEAEEVDLDRDILNAFDGQLLWLSDPLLDVPMTPADEDDEEQSPGNFALAVGMRDAKATEALVEKLLRSHGLHAARKSEDYQGATVRHLPLLGEFRWVFLPDALVIGFGAEGKKMLQGIIDRSVASARGEPAPEWSEQAKARRDALTNGWRDLGMTDASGSIGTVRSYLNLAFDQIQAEHESEPGMDTLVPALREGLDCWMRIAGQFDVLTTVSAMSVTPGHLRSESIQ
ncbi:MAG: hypothetical protein U1F36_00465 [Planctomycetota bacterium]